MARVIYAEDDRAIAALVKFRLSEDGHEVELVYDGADASDELADGHYDVVLLDVMMPGIDGFALCRQLAARDDRPVIILVSAKAGPADIASGMAAGADDYVCKPFDPSDLAARVRGLVRR